MNLKDLITINEEGKKMSDNVEFAIKMAMSILVAGLLIIFTLKVLGIV